ncbi:MAG: hypothetical protein HYY16_16260 [Planctomycetes bacterium]|nr:hypothetical protein [Planctomycetota bacterium]
MKQFPVMMALAALGGCVMVEEIDRVPARNPVGVDGVIDMVRSRVSEWHILAEIRANGVQRSPTADDIVALKQAGAGDRIISAMINAPVTTARAGEVRRTVYYDTRPAEGATWFTLGALLGWGLHFDHPWHHGCRW